MPITVTHSTTVPGFPQAYLYGTPPPSTYYISGTVTDADGNPAERTIRLYNRTTGALLESEQSDSVTGEFEFQDIGDAEFYVVAVADGAEEPDLIYRVTSGTDD